MIILSIGFIFLYVTTRRESADLNLNEQSDINIANF